MTVTVNIWIALIILAAAFASGWLVRNNNKGVKINQKP
jgi:hypothetical protein